MLPVYLEVPREAKKIINKNVGYMFELLKCTCEGLSYADDDDKIRLNQRKPSKYKGLSRFGPEKTCNESTNL